MKYKIIVDTEKLDKVINFWISQGDIKQFDDFRKGYIHFFLLMKKELKIYDGIFKYSINQDTDKSLAMTLIRSEMDCFLDSYPFDNGTTLIALSRVVLASLLECRYKTSTKGYKKRGGYKIKRKDINDVYENLSILAHLNIIDIQLDTYSKHK